MYKVGLQPLRLHVSGRQNRSARGGGLKSLTSENAIFYKQYHLRPQQINFSLKQQPTKEINQSDL